MISDLLDWFDCLYMLTLLSMCCFYAWGWVEADLLCAVGQHTKGGPDRLLANGAYQLGRRLGERSRQAEGPVGRTIHAEGFESGSDRLKAR